MKQQYLEFIKQFSSINVVKICKKLGINRSNVLNGKSSEETTRLLYDEIVKELIELLKGDKNENISCM